MGAVGVCWGEGRGVRWKGVFRVPSTATSTEFPHDRLDPTIPFQRRSCVSHHHPFGARGGPRSRGGLGWADQVKLAIRPALINGGSGTTGRLCRRDEMRGVSLPAVQGLEIDATRQRLQHPSGKVQTGRRVPSMPYDALAPRTDERRDCRNGPVGSVVRELPWPRRGPRAVRSLVRQPQSGIQRAGTRDAPVEDPTTRTRSVHSLPRLQGTPPASKVRSRADISGPAAVFPNAQVTKFFQRPWSRAV